MNNSIILLSGGTGVGTSTFSFELAKSLGITNIVSTDWIREVIRSVLAEDCIPYMEKSTYNSGQTTHYLFKDEDVQKSEILRAFKNQSASIHKGIEGVIKRAVTENIPLIIEGVHLIPGKIRQSEIYKLHKDRISEFLVHIEEERTHKDRFLQRERISPERPMKKYLDNFREIRWIHDYFVERAKRYDGIVMLENSKSVREGLDIMLRNYYTRFTS